LLALGQNQIELMGGTRSSSLNDLVPDCIAHQLADGVEFELTHDVGAMSLRGLYANSQGDRNFLAALAFREELHDFALSRSKAAAENGHVIGNCVLFAETVE
jgi:hypothetical protein